jgi:hypothetical protein
VDPNLMVLCFLADYQRQITCFFEKTFAFGIEHGVTKNTHHHLNVMASILVTYVYRQQSRSLQAHAILSVSSALVQVARVR